jgi:drug/metabolite transporter (DMT)-like permease
MPLGVALALLSYSVYSISDSVVKGFGTGSLSAFEISFFVSLFALVALPFARSAGDNWRDIFRLRHPWLTNARALLQTTAALCFVVALTHIPFAETYSLVFLIPLFMTLLSVVALKERVSVARWILVAASFVGVLIVVRPGFNQLGIGHVAAIACAFAAAASNVILRIVSGGERHTSILALTGLYQVIIAGALMVFVGFVVPSPYDLLRLAIGGSLSGAGALLLIRGMQHSPASQIGPTNYVQIIWAVVLGALFYRETQDAIGYVGLALIIVAGVATVLSDGIQARIVDRWAEFRARRGEAAGNESDL